MIFFLSRDVFLGAGGLSIAKGGGPRSPLSAPLVAVSSGGPGGEAPPKFSILVLKIFCRELPRGQVPPLPPSLQTPMLPIVLIHFNKREQ